jgi:hypothetical protein
MDETGLREQLNHAVDATDSDELRYHLRAALQHLEE